MFIIVINKRLWMGSWNVIKTQWEWKEVLCQKHFTHIFFRKPTKLHRHIK